MSSDGAKAGSMVTYLSQKGFVEDVWKKIDFKSLLILRPGVLDRGELKNTMEKIMGFMMKPMPCLVSSSNLFLCVFQIFFSSNLLFSLRQLQRLSRVDWLSVPHFFFSNIWVRSVGAKYTCRGRAECQTCERNGVAQRRNLGKLRQDGRIQIGPFISRSRCSTIKRKIYLARFLRR